MTCMQRRCFRSVKDREKKSKAGGKRGKGWRSEKSKTGGNETKFLPVCLWGGSVEVADIQYTVRI